MGFATGADVEKIRRPWMPTSLPCDVVLLIFDFAAEGDNLVAAKALRLVNRECALRFAHPVWFVGARNHYFDYLLRLMARDNRSAARWLSTDSQGRVKLVARVSAEVARATVRNDRNFLCSVIGCNKYRI
tara:strand:+ start:2287 stop:2676 length:390 start_codon:yes stop_codon:yes gene_type:complete